MRSWRTTVGYWPPASPIAARPSFCLSHLRPLVPSWLLPLCYLLSPLLYPPLYPPLPAALCGLRGSSASSASSTVGQHTAMPHVSVGPLTANLTADDVAEVTARPIAAPYLFSKCAVATTTGRQLFLAARAVRWAALGAQVELHHPQDTACPVQHHLDLRQPALNCDAEFGMNVRLSI